MKAAYNTKLSILVLLWIWVIGTYNDVQRDELPWNLVLVLNEIVVEVPSNTKDNHYPNQLQEAESD